jgi:hypothetical protein
MDARRKNEQQRYQMFQQESLLDSWRGFSAFLPSKHIAVEDTMFA